MRDLKKTREAMRRQSRQRARAKKNPNIDEPPRLSPYKNLSLGGLESLAVAHMERYEDDVDIFQILTMALEVWPMVSADDDDVFADHLVDKVTAALEGDLDLYDGVIGMTRRLSEEAVNLKDEVKVEETNTTDYETIEDEDSAFEEHDEKRQCRE